MKTSFKLALVALVITISAASCGDGDKAKAKPDSLTTVPDTSKKDTVTIAPDSVAPLKTDTVKK